ncbi:hypothetical protein EDB83DRAFT_2390707 [Lactarius deliciosus]|nr:hypothetical protein EDB83DRAFT_2390707 [Lactarius deliciosus]
MTISIMQTLVVLMSGVAAVGNPTPCLGEMDHTGGKSGGEDVHCSLYYLCEREADWERRHTLHSVEPSKNRRDGSPASGLPVREWRREMREGEQAGYSVTLVESQIA